MNPGLPDSESATRFAIEVRFRHFARFPIALSDKLYRKDASTLGTVAGQLSSRPIADDTLFVFVSTCMANSEKKQKNSKTAI